MKKGFLSTLSISALFLILIAFALYTQKASFNEERVLSEMSASKKVLYVFNDISEEIDFGVFGINITKNETNLTIEDDLPAEFDILQDLKESVEFIEEHYATPDLKLSFLNDDGDEFNIIELDPWITISPWNIKYEYEDWGKKVLILTCPEQNCSKIIRHTLEIYTDNVFDYPPTPPNSNRYKWTPDRLKNNCAGISECMRFELYIHDGDGNVYSCPGPICNSNSYDLSKRSSLMISSSPCWINIQLGGSAWERDHYRVYEIKTHAPNNPNQECQIDFNIINIIEFEDSNYSVHLPLILKVKEVNYNISKQAKIYETD